MYFQLEVEYYSNEANKNKYRNFQLIASRKKQLKDGWRSDCTGHCTCNDSLSYFCLDLKVLCCLDLLLLESIFFKCKLCLSEQGMSLSIFISIRYTSTKTNKVIHNACSQGYPLLSTNVGVSPLHGLNVASLWINQVYLKIDEVKIKPYLATP